MSTDKKVFLLADDDVDDREMFCEALGIIDKNILCHSVVDGRAALDALDTYLPQLIFLDVNMPIMNGWQCLQCLKENEQYNNIPVVIISTSSHQREIDIAKSLNAFCYFTKPHDFNDLLTVLRTMVTNLGPHLTHALSTLEQADPRYVRVLE